MHTYIHTNMPTYIHILTQDCNYNMYILSSSTITISICVLFFFVSVTGDCLLMQKQL